MPRAVGIMPFSFEVGALAQLSPSKSIDIVNNVYMVSFKSHKKTQAEGRRFNPCSAQRNGVLPDDTLFLIQ